jgi:hypothetical protein
MLGLACSCLFNLMIRPEEFYLSNDFAGVRTANFKKRSSRRGFERRMFRRTTSALKYSCRFDMSPPPPLCAASPVCFVPFVVEGESFLINFARPLPWLS